MVADFEKRGNREFFNDKLLFKAVGIAFLLIIAFLIFEDIKIYQKKRELTAQISAYQKQIAEIKKSSENIKDEIANSDNIDYLEKLAYEQLNEQKPGEKEIVFITPEEKQKQNPAPKSFWDNLTGWLSQSWNWIKIKL